LLDLLNALEFLPFGLLIGVLGHWLAVDRGRGGWTASALSGACGALVGGMAGRYLRIWPDEGPQGFAMSLLGGLGFAIAFRALSGSSGRAIVPRPGAAPGPRSDQGTKPEAGRPATETAGPKD
jgi:uncharacterized membrane protein YeaQ/YmgE (transglycosylase-associated protein family)